MSPSKPRVVPGVSAGAVLAVIREQRATSRAAIAKETGLSRTTLANRLDTLTQHGLLVEAGTSATGGRPAEAFRFDESAGVILAADCGATRCRAGVLDLGGKVLAERSFDSPVADGPEPVLTRIFEVHQELLVEAGLQSNAVWGIGMGIPSPVDTVTQRPVRPPIMPGWDDFDISGWFRTRIDVPVFVDNDVNVMALGEYFHGPRTDRRSLVYVKVGTGIGSGLILDGQIHRGAQGAAGDIGHIRVHGADHVVCRCGNTGCLEAVAGGGALTQTLAESGLPVASVRDFVDLVSAGDPRAIQAVREGGRQIGGVLASVVNMINPEEITIGGSISRMHEHLLAGIREVVYQRSTVLATQQLRITESNLASGAGMLGCAVLAANQLLLPDRIDEAIARKQLTAEKESK